MLVAALAGEAPLDRPVVLGRIRGWPFSSPLARVLACSWAWKLRTVALLDVLDELEADAVLDPAQGGLGAVAALGLVSAPDVLDGTPAFALYQLSSRDGSKLIVTAGHEVFPIPCDFRPFV